MSYLAEMTQGKMEEHGQETWLTKIHALSASPSEHRTTARTLT